MKMVVKNVFILPLVSANSCVFFAIKLLLSENPCHHNLCL